MKRYFITGTDTNCGKTYVTCEILQYFKGQNKPAFAIKPVVSGSVEESGEFFYEDIRALQKYNENPNVCISGWRFNPPISPHIAAAKENGSLSVTEIHDFCQKYSDQELLFIEGAGGVMAPLNQNETWVDFLTHSQIPVILVVGMRLGCLNHALLTAHVLKSQGIICAGWIANCLDGDMLELEANIDTLRAKIEWPLLARVGYKDCIVPEKSKLTFL